MHKRDIRTTVAMMLAGIPFFKKSILDRYSCPNSSSWVALTIEVIIRSSNAVTAQ